MVNPKIVEFMALNTGKNPNPSDPNDNRGTAFADPENKLNSFMEKASLFVYKTPGHATDDITSMMWNSSGSSTSKDITKKTASYKHLARSAERIDKNQAMGINTQLPGESSRAPEYSAMPIGEIDYHQTLINTQLDNNFGENRGLLRHIGRVGTKNMRRHMTTDYFNTDAMNELGSNDVEGMSARKNSKNRNHLTK